MLHTQKKNDNKNINNTMYNANCAASKRGKYLVYVHKIGEK